VPGYGLAAAQAQHEIAELAHLLTDYGVNVRYAIHPVAGRMPGQMNVLLAEADVPYTQMLQLDEANTAFNTCDVALVIGANDVCNPDARKPGNAVSGMPILDVDHAKAVVVIKRSMNTGYAGIPNPLFTDPKTGMFFADAREALSEILVATKTYVTA
jgi:NAD(P) transhydrogenase subunit beta